MIKIDNLTKKYHAEQIFSNVNLELDISNIYFLMGKNGSGKTTFVKCLLGLEHYNGMITFDGNDLRTVRRNIFSVFDDIPFYNNLNGFENIRLIVDQTVPLKRNFEDLSLLTNEKLKKKVKTYSLGERKKLALMCALLQQPKYLILDEISNGLDIDSLEILQKYLSNLKQNTIVIVTGHHFEFYENIADKVLAVQNKSIIDVEEYKKGEDSLYEIYKKYTSCD